VAVAGLGVVVTGADGQGGAPVRLLIVVFIRPPRRIRISSPFQSFTALDHLTDPPVGVGLLGRAAPHDHAVVNLGIVEVTIGDSLFREVITHLLKLGDGSDAIGDDGGDDGGRVGGRGVAIWNGGRSGLLQKWRIRGYNLGCGFLIWNNKRKYAGSR
jgi:hypothetical protein